MDSRILIVSSFVHMAVHIYERSGMTWL